MKKTQFKYKKPNSFIYGIYHLACKVVGKFSYNTKVLRNELKKAKGSYVVIANHESKIDFINLSLLSKRKMHIVVSNSFYQTLSIRPLMDMISVIPKQQFQTTTADIRKMKRAVENNVPLGIYPVGLMAENGLSTDPGVAIAKLLKLLNTDVYVCYSEGSYLTQPKWSKVRRKGQITVDAYKLISKEDLADISSDELYKLVRQSIDYNSYENQKKNMVKYKNGNNVEGLEYVLYQCPKCKKTKTIVSKDTSKLRCTCCGYEVEANEYSLFEGNELIYDTPSEWSMEILENLKNEMDNNPDYKLEDKVTISMINYKKHRFEEVGQGSISIDKDKIVLKGIINDTEVEHKFSTSSYPMLPFIPGKSLEIQDGPDIFKLEFSDPYNIMKFINILKIVNKSYL